MKILGLRGFWLKAILYGHSPRVVVLREIYANETILRLLTIRCTFLSSLFIIHRRFSCDERFMP